MTQSEMVDETKTQRFSFRTPYGKVITFQPANMTTMALIEAGQEKKLRKKGVVLDPPTYIVSTAGGGSQKFEHDEETIKTHPEAEAQFRAYLDGKQQLQAAINRAKYEYTLECITNQLPEDNRWASRLEAKGLDIPTDPDELRSFYITNELIRTPEDALLLFVEVTTAGLSGAISEDDIAKVRDNFRSIVPGGSNGDGSIVERLSRSVAEASGELETQPTPDRSQDGEGMGADPVSIPESAL